MTSVRHFRTRISSRPKIAALALLLGLSVGIGGCNILTDWCPVAADDEVFFYPEVGKTWEYSQRDSHSSIDGLGDWRATGTVTWTVTSAECQVIETHFTILEEGEGVRVNNLGSPNETETEYSFSREISGKLVGSELFLGRYASGGPIHWRYRVSEPDTKGAARTSGCGFGGCDVSESITLERGVGMLHWRGGGDGRGRTGYSLTLRR